MAGATPTTRIALRYAQEVHAGQRRRADGAAFILHPFEVASLLSDSGAPDPGRSHFTIGGHGWEEVADYALDWALAQAATPAAA